MTETRVHIFISGRVQGVNFRYYTQQQAQSRGLKGWVRNLPDGRVEAVFEGDEARVESMVDWCHQGPRMASVDKVEANWENPTGGFEDFTVRF